MALAFQRYALINVNSSQGSRKSMRTGTTTDNFSFSELNGQRLQKNGMKQ